MCCARITEWLVRRSFRPTDTAPERELKRVVVPVYAYVCIAILVLTFGALPSRGRPFLDGVLDIGMLVGAGSLFSGLVGSMIDQSPRDVAQSTLCGCLVAIILLDWNAASKATARTWNLAVLLMDLGLIADISQASQRCIMGAVLLWLAAQAYEEAARNGLYEAAFFEVYPVIEVCDCAKPPCPQRPATAFTAYCMAVIVFTVDFWFTRGFADNVRGSVSLAQTVAKALARYDLPEASAALHSKEGLPVELRDAYAALIDNLASYRSYLPQSLLVPETLPRGLADCVSSTSRTPDSEPNTGSSRGSGQTTQPDDMGNVLPFSPASLSPRSWLSGSPRAGSPARDKRQSISSADVTSVAASFASRRRRRSSAIRSDASPRAGMSSKSLEYVPPVAVGLETRSIALVYVNVCQYHSQGLAEASKSTGLILFHQCFIEGILAASRPKGTVDLVVGDRGRIAFNAAQQCPAYRVTAVLTSLHASSTRIDTKYMSDNMIRLSAFAQMLGAKALDLSVGCASGVALVGNVGCEELRSFSIVGTVCGWAHAIERISAQGLGCCIVDGAIAERPEVTSVVALRLVPLLVRHCKHRHSVAHRLVSIEGHIHVDQHGEQEEWMYQRQIEQKANPHYKYNQAVESYLDGELAQADDWLRHAHGALADGLREKVVAARAGAGGAEWGAVAAPPPAVLHDAAQLPPSEVLWCGARGRRGDGSPTRQHARGGRLPRDGSPRTAAVGKVTESLMREMRSAEETMERCREDERLQQQRQLDSRVRDKREKRAHAPGTVSRGWFGTMQARSSSPIACDLDAAAAANSSRVLGKSTGKSTTSSGVPGSSGASPKDGRSSTVIPAAGQSSISMQTAGQQSPQQSPQHCTSASLLPQDWSPPGFSPSGLDVSAWLASIALPEYVTLFKANHIGEEELNSLDANDLKELGISSVGHRKRIISSIQAMTKTAPVVMRPVLTI